MCTSVRSSTRREEQTSTGRTDGTSTGTVVSFVGQDRGTTDLRDRGRRKWDKLRQGGLPGLGRDPCLLDKSEGEDV